MDRKINFRRWSDVILLGLVSYALVYLIASVEVIQTKFGEWINLFASLHMGVQILLGLTGFFCARHLLLFFNVIHKRQLKHIKLFLLYPPITFSIVLCLLLFLPQFDITGFLGDTFFASYLLVSALLFIILLSLLCAFDSLYSEKREDKQERALIPEWIKNEEQKNHYRWLMSERPLDKSDKDMLGREVYVDRIVRLFESDDGEPRGKANHIAIVGPFGIGKTSVWERVQQKLGDNYIFAPIDGWGRGKGTVSAQIIDEIVAALTNYVDCASIRNVPQEYMDALSGADFKGIFALAKILPLHSHQSPDELIKKIETILLSIGKTMVVVLEDFDRNPQGEIIMNEVAGLLDRLRELRSINFIVCVAPGIESHLLSRISTHREDLFAFDALEFVDATLDLMKSYADSRSHIFFNGSDDETKNAAKAISAVIKTPRDAKYALRRAFSAWESLVGEVNAYDLVAANVLRYSAPKAFDCIVENFDRIRSGVADVEKLVASNLVDPSEYKDVAKYMEAKLSEPQKAAVIKVLDSFSKVGIAEVDARLAIQILISKWNSISGGVSRMLFQRVSGWQGKIYLERIVSEQVSSVHEGESDKEFFAAIYANDALNTDGYLDKLVHSAYLTEKFVEVVFQRCYMAYELKLISEKFLEFLIKKCTLGMDIFCGEIANGSPDKICVIIKELKKRSDIDVFKLFIEAMQTDPEKLLDSLEGSLRGVHSAQHTLWEKHKVDLETCLSKSDERAKELINRITENAAKAGRLLE